MNAQAKLVAPSTLARGPEKNAAVAPRRNAITTAASSSKNSAKTNGRKAAEQSPPKTIREFVSALDELMAKAIAAAGCKDEAAFKRLPREEQNAFMAQARGTSAAKGSGYAGGLQLLDPKTIRRSPFNRNDFDADELTKLVADVKANGVIQPGIVRPVRPPAGKIEWELIAGERRWTAASRAGVLFPATVREAGDTETLELQAIENMHREDLNPIDEAVKYEQLRAAYEKEGMSRTQAIAKIEEKTGKATATIYERLALMKLPEKVRKQVLCGDLPPSHAGLLVKISDPSTIEQLAKTITTAPPGRGDDGLLSFRESKQLADAAVKREKNLAEWQRQREQFVAKGLRVLTANENAAWIDGRDDGDYWYTKHNAPLVNASGNCDLQGADYRPYNKLWKKEPPKILGCLPNGMPVVVYDDKLAEAAVRAGGKLRSTGGSGSGSSEAERKKAAAHKRRGRDFVDRLGQIVKSIETSLDSTEFWRFFAASLVRQWRSDPIRRLAARRGWKRGSGDSLIQAELSKMGVHELRGVCAEILLYADSPSLYCEGWGRSITAASVLCKVPLPGWKNADEVQASGDVKI